MAGDSLGTIVGVIESDVEQKKVFPLFDRYGVGLYGCGEVDSNRGNVTVYQFLREYEQTETCPETPSLVETAKAIGKRLFTQRWNYLSGYKDSFTEDDWRDMFGGIYQGVHIAGYEQDGPAIYHVIIKVEPYLMRMDAPYFPADNKEYFEGKAGNVFLVNGEERNPVPQFPTVDEMRAYAVSLIQREAKNDRSVGGEIKVGLITLASGFIWLPGASVPRPG
jgi:hypothetical protein